MKGIRERLSNTSRQEVLSGLVPETAGKPGAKAKAQLSKPGKLSKFLKPSAKKKNQKKGIKNKPSAKKKAAHKQAEKALADKALSKQKLKHSQKPESPPPLPPPAEKPEQAELLNQQVIVSSEAAGPLSFGRQGLASGFSQGKYHISSGTGTFKVSQEFVSLLRDALTVQNVDVLAGPTSLPVTGELPAEMWNEEDLSVAKDICVEDFMATELAKKFFCLWKEGKVTDRLVGSRFGYGVLGRFYGDRDLERQSQPEPAAESAEHGELRNVATGRGEGTLGSAGGGVAGSVEAGELRDMEPGCEEGAIGSAGGGGTEEGGPVLATGKETAAVETTGAEMAASATSPTAGMPGTSSTDGSALSGRRVPAGSKQTSLSHWLL